MNNPKRIIPPLFAVFFLAVPCALIGDGDVRAVQEQLVEEGIDPGPIDGILGPKTRAGLREFQRRNGLSVTGRMDDERKTSRRSVSRLVSERFLAGSSKAGKVLWPVF